MGQRFRYEEGTSVNWHLVIKGLQKDIVSPALVRQNTHYNVYRFSAWHGSIKAWTAELALVRLVDQRLHDGGRHACLCITSASASRNQSHKVHRSWKTSQGIKLG